MIRYLVVIIAFILASSLALAPAVTQSARAANNVERSTFSVQATALQTISIPYEFEPIDFSDSDAPPLPLPDLVSVPFINQMGSMALTVFQLIDQFSIFGKFVLIILSVWVIWWLWSFVTRRSSQITLRLTEGLETAASVIDQQNASIQEGLTYYEENHLALGDGASDRYQMDRARLQSNRQLSSGIRQGSKLFRRARRDFGGNPFK